MDFFLPFIVFTANILGSFSDPFEFAGDYGDEINPIRAFVFEQVVSKEALAANQTEEIIDLAIQQDKEHGPTLGELVTADLLNQLSEKQQQLESAGFCKADLQAILHFIDRYKDQKVFRFFRHNPSDLLSLDKILRDKAAREGREFDLPILSSTGLLKGNNATELKGNLMDALFNAKTLYATKPQTLLQKSLEALESDYLKSYLGSAAENDDLTVFTTAAGQLFFYWLYQSLNLDLVAQDPAMIPKINHVKKSFAETLGNPLVRAEELRNKLIEANASVLFTQESDSFVPEELIKEGLFHPINTQNPGDGTFVLLRSTDWEADYELISIEGYDGFQKGRLNVILATQKQTGMKFMLASAHGNSTRAEDGRLQISKITEKYHTLAQLPGNQSLQLVIGIDANTKTEQDVLDLKDHLELLGLEGTEAGPTTIKMRMVTAQHGKAGRFAIDEEDYLIILKPDLGGLFRMDRVTVGFQEDPQDPLVPLPNIKNGSDHYPVGATLSPQY